MIALTPSDRRSVVPDPQLDTSPGRRDWPANGLPIVFRTPPSHYAVAKPEQLAEWEQMTAEGLGLSVTKSDDHYASSWLETVSFCGSKPDGDPNPCDSDVLPAVMEA